MPEDTDRGLFYMVQDIVLETKGFRSFFAKCEGRKEAYDKEILNELMGIRNELKSVRMELSLISEVIVDLTKEDDKLN